MATPKLYDNKPDFTMFGHDDAIKKRREWYRDVIWEQHIKPWVEKPWLRNNGRNWVLNYNLENQKEEAEFLKMAVHGFTILPDNLREVIQYDFLRRHPEYERDWILSKKVRKIGQFGTQSPALIVNKGNGDDEIISYMSLVKPDKHANRKMLLGARNSVKKQTEAYKEACGRTGQEWDVDHKPPWEFHNILGKWIEVNGRDPKIEEDDAGNYIFAKDDLATFRKLHKKLADLQCIPRATHRKLSGARRLKQEIKRF